MTKLEKQHSNWAKQVYNRLERIRRSEATDVIEITRLKYIVANLRLIDTNEEECNHCGLNHKPLKSTIPKKVVVPNLSNLYSWTEKITEIVNELRERS